VIDLVNVQHVTEEHQTVHSVKVTAYELVFLYAHLSLRFLTLSWEFLAQNRGNLRNEEWKRGWWSH